MPRQDYLFNRNSLRLVIEAQGKSMAEEIGQLEPRQVLEASLDDLVRYFETKYRIEPLVLKEDGITVDQEDTKVDVSGDPRRVWIRNRTGPALIPGTRISYFVPFDGDPGLFQCQPSEFGLSEPHGVVQGTCLVLSYTQPVDASSAADFKAEFERDMDQIRKRVHRIAGDLESFNSGLPGQVRQLIESRRQKLLNDRNLAATLGFPVRRRDDAPQTYSVPTVRRPIRPSLPPTPQGPPEPTLDMGTYDEILRIMRNMVLVMERSPKAFQTMGEEDIRQHLLVQLNGQFEGQATGETFNGEGKTDILIRYEGRNIFIAECKFWQGPKAFAEAIDQLLGYATWRDTKTALVVFNRGRKLSTVLDAVQEVIRGRSELVREHRPLDETSFRYTLRQPDDPKRELLLTVLFFDVPSTK